MSKTVFYVLLGESGSGKDFTSGLMGYPVIKFAAPYKRKLENNFGLPTGSLEYRQVKNLSIPYDDNTSYLDLLISEYHRQKPIYEADFQRYLADYADLVKDIQFYTQAGLPVMFTDCRNTYEAKLIKFLADADWVEIVVHHLYRDGSKRLSSDDMMEEIEDILCREPNKTFHIRTTNATPDRIRNIYKEMAEMHQ